MGLLRKKTNHNLADLFYCSSDMPGDDITLDISQSSGTASPPQESRTKLKRKKTQTSKMASNPSVNDVNTGTDTTNDRATTCDDQTRDDDVNLVIWR